MKIKHLQNQYDAPQDSLIDSITSLNVKRAEEQKIGARPLARSTLG